MGQHLGSGKTSRNHAKNLDPLFNPDTVAVFGSLREGWFGGYVAIENLKKFGFLGQVFPVNPSHDGNEVLGYPVYSSLEEIPSQIDLAVVIVNALNVPKIIKECVAKGVKAAVVVSDGMAERDDMGEKLQEETVKIARTAGLRLIGPNTIGVANSANGFITCPYQVGYDRIKKGGVALVSQSGIFGPQALPLEDTQYGISKICDFGNKCDVNETELLEYLACDSETKVIAMHIEDIKDVRYFVEVSKRIARKKPILILKPGRTHESAKAMASHTGSLAGSDEIYDGILKQAGVIRVEHYRELFDYAKMLALQPLPKGNRLGIITITGGGGIMAIDSAVKSGLALAELSPGTLEKLAEIFPSLANNPADLGAAVPVMGNPVLQNQIRQLIIHDEHVDCIAIAMYAGAVIERQQVQLREFEELKHTISKPIAIWIYGTRVPSIEEMSRTLEGVGFPVFLDFETAAKALAISYTYSKIKNN
ncbi:MAG: CoA-binding protein [Thermodesulfobacteriota bacterium]|nr:CoA-binding protein [Thermodesulfobacteriota bacterium]